MSRIITLRRDGEPIYDITIERDYGGIGKIIDDLGVRGRRICIVADSRVASLYLDDVKDAFRPYASKVISFTFQEGEQSKNLDTVKNLYEKLIIEHFDRNDIIAALGGGVTGDLSGYAAATFLRGIRVIQLPTSLLAMVDSSIGGKTGVDFKGYKNMVGAFHQPSAVYINISALLTLTDRQYFSGFGEIIKHGLIRDIKYFDYLGENAEKLNGRDLDALECAVAKSCEIKRAVVQRDPTEKGERAILNFGHTLGHAIEKLLDFKMLHGECVAIGMTAAGYLSMKLGMISSEDYDSIRKMIVAFNLPLSVSGINAEEVLRVSKNDKKMDAGRIKFILLDGLGNAVICDKVSDDYILEALGAVLN